MLILTPGNNAAAVMSAPVIAEVEQQPIGARLAFTGLTGWAVVTRRDNGTYAVRPGGRTIRENQILAWAELPPVPQTAA
jgi:hypothetical protein